MKIREEARFKKEREELNEKVMKYAGKEIKRFFSLDSMVYKPGALDKKTKELLGLVSSTVLRCDDCVKYHTISAFNEGVTSDEFQETMSVAMMVGGSITIPHVRRAMTLWDELVEDSKDGR
ncbi:MAG TPA: carboxymuconolactone decarboxylase family protein [Euryarchaeota archaeon]|nr:carboxymuconolactone decarboxylase family protein [Euryarchaeota archaeon]